MEEVISRSIASERSILILLGLFAAIALLLTAAGIWGTMAYLLSQRRREIGLRLALGATEGVLVRDAVARAMKLVTAGLIAGVALSLGLARLTSTTLFGVSPTDPRRTSAWPHSLAAVAWMANYCTRQADHALHIVCGAPAGVKSGAPESWRLC
jgi:ABC-type antimicrobial peptide transport system permease subunit